MVPSEVTRVERRRRAHAVPDRAPPSAVVRCGRGFRDGDRRRRPATRWAHPLRRPGHRRHCRCRRTAPPREQRRWSWRTWPWSSVEPGRPGRPRWCPHSRAGSRTATCFAREPPVGWASWECRRRPRPASVPGDGNLCQRWRHSVGVLRTKELPCPMSSSRARIARCSLRRLRWSTPRAPLLASSSRSSVMASCDSCST